MSTTTITSCDNPDCDETRGDNAHGWISITQGNNRFPSNDFCSWGCVAAYGQMRWEPKERRRKTDKKPVVHIDGAPYLRDAVQPPLPGEF